MWIEPLNRIDQIRVGDLLLISDGKEITHAKAQMVKVSEHDGTEVIFNLRKNKFFNVGMYLEGRSWAKEVYVVTIYPKCPFCNGNIIGSMSAVRELVLSNGLVSEMSDPGGRVLTFADGRTLRLGDHCSECDMIKIRKFLEKKHD